MKTKFFLIASIVALAMTFGSCEKMSQKNATEYLTAHTWQMSQVYIEDTQNGQWLWEPSMILTHWNFYEDGTGDITVYYHGINQTAEPNGHGVFEWEFSRRKPEVDHQYQEWDVADSDIGYMVIRQDGIVHYCAIEALDDDVLELSNFAKFIAYTN